MMTRFAQDAFSAIQKSDLESNSIAGACYNDEGNWLYVGQAKFTFDKRIWTHQSPGTRYIDLIPFDHRFAFLCLALEGFLICRLDPPVNKQGRGYTIPREDGCVVPNAEKVPRKKCQPRMALPEV